MGIPGGKGKSPVANGCRRTAATCASIVTTAGGRPCARPRARLEAGLSSGMRRIDHDDAYLSACGAQPRDRDRAQPPPTRCDASSLDAPLAQAESTSSSACSPSSARCRPRAGLRLARRHPGALAPTSQMRTVRELEPPATDEGFEQVEAIAFARHPAPDRPAHAPACSSPRPGSSARAGSTRLRGRPRRAPPVVPPESRRLARRTRAGPRPSDRPGGWTRQGALCPHPGGPPTCRCARRSRVCRSRSRAPTT